MDRRGAGREMDRKKEGRKPPSSSQLWLFARNPLSSQVTMGQTQGRQVGKQDSAHLEHSETPGLSGSSEPARMSSKSVTMYSWKKPQESPIWGRSLGRYFLCLHTSGNTHSQSALHIMRTRRRRLLSEFPKLHSKLQTLLALVLCSN